MCTPFSGYKKLFHAGVYSSYNCRMTLLPDVSIGVWVCTNSPGGPAANIAVVLLNQFVIDLLLGTRPFHYRRNSYAISHQTDRRLQ